MATKRAGIVSEKKIEAGPAPGTPSLFDFGVEGIVEIGAGDGERCVNMLYRCTSTQNL